MTIYYYSGVLTFVAHETLTAMKITFIHPAGEYEEHLHPQNCKQLLLF
jgi:hypothetical protein